MSIDRSIDRHGTKFSLQISLHRFKLAFIDERETHRGPAFVFWNSARVNMVAICTETFVTINKSLANLLVCPTKTVDPPFASQFFNKISIRYTNDAR